MGLELLDYYELITSLTLLAISSTIAFVSFPSSHIDVYYGTRRKHNVLRTFVYHLDLIINICHFTTHTLDLAINPCYFIIYALNLIIDLCCFVVYTVGKRQELCRCHTNFILCQFIQSLECVLDLRLPQQLLQILFWSEISGRYEERVRLETHLFVLALSALSR